MSQKRLRIAIMPSNRPTFSVMALLAEFLHTDTPFDPILIVDIPQNQKILSSLLNHPIHIHCLFPDVSPPKAEALLSTSRVSIDPTVPASALKRFYKAIVPRFVRDIRYTLSQQLQQYWQRTIVSVYQQEKKIFDGYQQVAKKYFEAYAIQAIILPSDRLGGHTLALLSRADQLKIPIIAYPTALAYPQALAVRRAYHAKFRKNSMPYYWLKQYLLWRYPKQGYSIHQTQVLYFEPLRTLVYAQAKTLPQLPWTHGGGNSTQVWVSGTESKGNYIKWGVSPDKLVVMGTLEQDLIYEAFQHREVTRLQIQDQYQLSSQAKLIIYAIPPLSEQYTQNDAKYWQGIKDVLSLLQQKNYAVLVSLHPKSDPQQYENLVKAYDAILLKQPLREVLPVAEIYVTNYSSTVDWSIMLQIPVIIADFSLPNDEVLEDFKQPAIMFATSTHQLSTYIDAVTQQSDIYHHYKKHLALAAAVKAPFDGQVKARIYQTIKNTLGV